MQQYLNLGRNSVEKIGKAAGATVRIGSRVLYDREKIDAYLERLAQEQAAL